MEEDSLSLSRMALTQYPQGSLRELWKISFPLMLSSFSVTLMLFVDRLLLARYSQAAFNAVVSASTLGWSFILGWLALASISEVFVAQFNGSGDYKKTGGPVWQMIWVSLFSVFFFLPMSLWGVDLIYGDDPDTLLRRDYLRIMMFFGPSFPLFGALSGFFVGMGRVNLITALTLGANIVNASLDYVFIFGVEGVFEPLGVRGAALATCGSEIFVALILFSVFLKKKHRENFGTGYWKIDLSLLWYCCRVGFPGALLAAFEILGWAVYYMIMTYASVMHITIAGICQTFVIICYFFGEGINKGISAIAGNLIGSKKPHLAVHSLFAGLKLHLLFFILVFFCFTFFSREIFELFQSDPYAEALPDFYTSLKTCMILTAFYILFEGLRLLFAGALTAAGDTLFLFISGLASVWFLLVFPVYIAVVYYQLSIEGATVIAMLYGLGTSLIYFWRFRSGVWKTLSIMS